MKKSISICILMIMFIYIFQNIVLGLTEMDTANIKKGSVIDPEVELFDEDLRWHPMKMNYVYYTSKEGNFPAYSVSCRK